MEAERERSYEIRGVCFNDQHCASFFRSYLHRDLDLQASNARVQGNLAVRHKDSAEQHGTRTN